MSRERSSLDQRARRRWLVARALSHRLGLDSGRVSAAGADAGAGPDRRGDVARLAGATAAAAGGLSPAGRRLALLLGGLLLGLALALLLGGLLQPLARRGLTAPAQGATATATAAAVAAPAATAVTAGGMDRRPAAAPPPPGVTWQPLDVVAAYVQASILAGWQGDATLLQPYVLPDSAVWQAIRDEYARRARVGERHQATLVRWGLVGQTQGATFATLETQEVWDDLVWQGTRLVAQRHGVILRVRYELRRTAPDAPWRIEHVASTTVVPSTTPD